MEQSVFDVKAVFSGLFPQDLLEAIQCVYHPSGLNCTHLAKELESEEYGASIFELKGRSVKFRMGKITPTKVGQFVTLWKRIGNSEIMPHDLEDPFDFFVISVRHQEHFGQFVFPKRILFEQGVLSKEGKWGKRAMRVYPPWDIVESKQAKKTQAWQQIYFFEIPAKGNVDFKRMRGLFGFISEES